MHHSVLLECVLVSDLWLKFDGLFSVLRDANSSWETASLNLVGDEDTLSKDIISDDLATNDSSNNLARVNTNPHIELLVSVIFSALSDLLDDVNHLETSLNHSVSLIDHDASSSFVLVDFAVVAHDHVAVANRVNFINLVLFTKLVKSGEELAQQIDHLFGVSYVLREGGEATHVSLQKSNILELIDLPLLVLNDAQDMEWHQLGDEKVRLFDLDVQDSLIVQRLSLDHLAMMDAHSQQD